MNIRNLTAAMMIGATCMATSAWGFNKVMYPYTLPSGAQGAAMGCVEAKSGMTLELGKWYTNFQVCKDYADKNGIPLLAVWSNSNCIHCWYFDVCLIQDAFKEWQKTHGAGQVICCFMAGGHGGYDQANSAAYNWMWYGGGTRLNAYPFVVLWWKKGNVNVRMTGDEARGNLGLMEKYTPESTQNFIAKMERAFAKWSPVPSYAGGVFSAPNTTYNRLEAEAGTSNVVVNITRESDVKTVATNVQLVVKSPNGAVLSTQSVTWPAGSVSVNARIAIPAGTFTKNGQKLTLTLNDGGAVKSTTYITYVQKKASAANPLWIGEPFDFGDWTCDIDAAKAKVKSFAGTAYTIVSVQGSMWCPDCANTDRNFLNVTNAAGANRFCAWARSNNVALVSVDIPNYTGSKVTDRATPTLFSTDAYATTLARIREYPQSGADPTLTNAIVRSGLGYMTRKGITEQAALKVLDKFHTLCSTNTIYGGFHRPEDANKNRTGVPIFVLLRKDGSVAARFTKFAATSPMAADRANFDNYIKRFDEMLALAATSGSVADRTEIENNYPSAGSANLVANGGKISGTLSHTDQIDTFKLVNLSGNAIENVKVKGRSSAEVTVEFVELSGGVATVVGSQARGKLKDGINLSYEFKKNGAYYVRVGVADASASAFAADSGTANNFHSYTIEGSAVLVPQEDVATGAAATGSETVTMRLVKDTLYRFEGIEATGNESVLSSVATVGAYRFLKALSGGDLSLKIASGAGGTIKYQIWKPGAVGFTETEREVTESVTDLKDDNVVFTVARTGGKSGSVKVRVTVDMEKTTLDEDCYSFQTTDLTWKDGETASKSAKVKIIDNVDSEYNANLVFTLEVVSSDAGDVKVADGKGQFTLTVVRDDKTEPGQCCFSRVTPFYARRNTVYAREGDGAKLWVSRVDGATGLVEAEIKSSVSGVSYSMENSRDITNLLGKTIIYWSNRESGEKYIRVKGIPAGKTARFTLVGRGNFGVVRNASVVSVVSVSDKALSFADETVTMALHRYVQAEYSFKLASKPSGKVSLIKTNGRLPSGLKVSYDSDSNAMLLSGTPTGAGGSYSVVYSAKDSQGVGMPIQLNVNLDDPTDSAKYPEIANPSLSRTRTFKDVAVVNVPNGRMVGLLTVTVPPKGNVSASYTGLDRKVSFKCKSWTAYEDNRNITAELSGSRDGYAMSVVVEADGSLDVSLRDPAYPGVSLDAKIGTAEWSAQNTAKAWAGYYTLALPVENVVTNTAGVLMPTGSGYLSIEMSKNSDYKAGRFRWKGMLPNGTAISGTSTLVSGLEALGSDWAILPIYKTTRTDVFSALLKIRKNAVSQQYRRCIESFDGVSAFWDHVETKTSAEYWVDLGCYGSYYDTDEDLGGCCYEGYQTERPSLIFDTESLVEIFGGKPVGVYPIKVIVSKDNIALEDKDNELGVTLSFARKSGIVSGRFNLPVNVSGLVTYRQARYQGIVLTGWGEGCGCGPQYEKYMPFVNGSFYLQESGVKRAGPALVDIPEGE